MRYNTPIRSVFANSASATIFASRPPTEHACFSQETIATVLRFSTMNWPTSCCGVEMPACVRRSKVTGPTPGTCSSDDTA